MCHFGNSRTLRGTSPNGTFCLMARSITSNGSGGMFVPVLMLSIRVDKNPRQFCVRTFVYGGAGGTCRKLGCRVATSRCRGFRRCGKSGQEVGLLLGTSNNSLIIGGGTTAMVGKVEVATRLTSRLATGTTGYGVSFSSCYEALLRNGAPAITLAPSRVRMVGGVMRCQASMVGFTKTCFGILHNIPGDREPGCVITKRDFTF